MNPTFIRCYFYDSVYSKRYTSAYPFKTILYFEQTFFFVKYHVLKNSVNRFAVVGSDWWVYLCSQQLVPDCSSLWPHFPTCFLPNVFETFSCNVVVKLVFTLNPFILFFYNYHFCIIGFCPGNLFSKTSRYNMLVSNQNNVVSDLIPLQLFIIYLLYPRCWIKC